MPEDGLTDRVSGPQIPAGYESVYDAATRSGQSVQVLKRRLRREEIDGAYKVPWRGGGLWVVPAGVRIPDLGGGKTIDESTRTQIVGRARTGENRAALAREFGVDRSYVYKLMERYADGESDGGESDGGKNDRE